MTSRALRRRTIIAMTLTASIVLSITNTASASPASDDPYSVFESSPTTAVTVNPAAEVHLLDLSSSTSPTALRVVSGTGSVILQEVGESNRYYPATIGAVENEFDLSTYLDSVTGVSSTTLSDWSSGSGTYALRAYVMGTKDGVPAVAWVTSPSTTTTNGLRIGTPDSVSINSMTAQQFEAAAGVSLDKIKLLNAAGSGMVTVYDDGSNYVMKRLTNDLQSNPAYNAVTLSLSHVPRSFDFDTYGNLISSRDGGLDTLSMYSPDTVTSIDLPSLGVAEEWTDGAYRESVIADSDGDIAVVDFAQTPPTAQTLNAGGDVTALAYISLLDEVQAVTHGAKEIQRFSAADGTSRESLNLPGTVVAGSLRSSANYARTSELVAIGNNVFDYRGELITRGEPWFTPSLSVQNRGDGVTFSASASGSGVSGVTWEYSLDNGVTWAERSATWDTATPDTGTITHPAPEIPAPLDGVAPFLRQDVANANASVSYGITENTVGIATEQYDALWRYRVESTYGSVPSASTKIVIASEQEEQDPITVTNQPAAARISDGETVSFSATAEAAEGSPTIQWERSTDGETWTPITDATSTQLSFTATTAENGVQVRAVFTAGSDTAISSPALLEVMSVPSVNLSAAPAGSTKIVDAAYKLDLNTYSHDWLRRTAGSNVQLGENSGYDFSGGTGWTDPSTGETHVAWSGAAIHLPYGGSFGLYLSIANPYLAISSDGRATLTADVAWNDGGGVWSGPVGDSYERVIIATFAETEIATDGNQTTIIGTPEWEGRIYTTPGLGDGNIYESSFPASFLDYLAEGNRAWFHTTGSLRDVEKSPLPVDINFTVTTDPASNEGTRIDPVDPLGEGKNPFTPSDPIIISQPQSVVIGIGQETTLRAGASGSPTPSIQWQRKEGEDWVDIDGATNSTYTVIGTEVGETSYRAVFSSTDTSINSDEVTVTVQQEQTPPSSTDWGSSSEEDGINVSAWLETMLTIAGPIAALIVAITAGLNFWFSNNPGTSGFNIFNPNTWNSLLGK